MRKNQTFSINLGSGVARPKFGDVKKKENLLGFFTTNKALLHYVVWLQIKKIRKN